jgi:hypothetical protein
VFQDERLISAVTHNAARRIKMAPKIVVRANAFVLWWKICGIAAEFC